MIHQQQVHIGILLATIIITYSDIYRTLSLFLTLLFCNDIIEYTVHCREHKFTVKLCKCHTVQHTRQYGTIQLYNAMQLTGAITKL